MVSSNQLKKLGKRLRDGSRSLDDLNMLTDYKATFDAPMFELNSIINDLIRTLGTPAIVSGRAKRTKSIIRKLCRPRNHGMDLSRVDDIAGLRIVVTNTQEQLQLIDSLKSLDSFSREYNYLDRRGAYRAVHLVFKFDSRLLEVQTRSCAQHLWAEESESFGEIVKEGGGPKQIRDYLTELSQVCYALDHSDGYEHSSEYFDQRSIITSIFPALLESFEQVTRSDLYNEDDYTYLVVYDNLTAQHVKTDTFWSDERQEALIEYKRLTSLLNENRYDVILFNSRIKEALYVTHSRYFPKAIFR